MLRSLGTIICPILFIKLAFLMVATGTPQKDKALAGMVNSMNFDNSWGLAGEIDLQDIAGLFGPTAVHRGRTGVNLNVLLPIMIRGMLIGIDDRAIDKRKTRRRPDASRKSPLFFPLISRVGATLDCFIFQTIAASPCWGASFARLAATAPPSRHGTEWR